MRRYIVECGMEQIWLILSVVVALITLVGVFGRQAEDPVPAYGWPLGLLCCLALANWLFPIPVTEPEAHYPPAITGLDAGLQLGLKAQTQLPARPADKPVISWLKQTLNGRKVIAKPIVIFREPGLAGFRRQGANQYFKTRFGWQNALDQSFQPRVIILHSTESESEAHAFSLFDYNSRSQYLGGTWTHFCVDPQGQIYQYGPLNRISKGQAGLDDIGVGIEIVGTASLWQSEKQIRQGSIMQRWQSGQAQQVQAVLDLIRSLQQHYQIPRERIFSHEALGHIRELKGPEFLWLRRQIRDRVYLGLEPLVDQNYRPTQWFDFLEPYDRQDPGRDLMELIKDAL